MEYHGTMPMTGIDIEPDEGNFTANTIQLDNVEITDVTQYGIVNQHRRCSNLTITNSKIENFDAPDAKLVNTHLVYDNSKEIYVEYCEIDKSHIELKNRTHLLKLHNVKLLDTLVESSGTTTGTIRFTGDECDVINCTFRNLKGEDKFTTNVHGYGIQIHNGWVTTFNNSGNTYENCNIYNLGNQAINESQIKNCNIYMLLNNMSGTTALNKCNFENGKLMCYTKITLDECQLKNIEYTWGDAGDDSIKIIKNSNIEGTFKSLAFDNGSIIDNSTIIAKNKLASNVFNNVQFKNLTKIILKQNKGTYNIKNLQSVLGKDYTVQLGD